LKEALNILFALNILLAPTVIAHLNIGRLLIKGTVSRERYELKVKWMDKAEFGDESLIVFVTLSSFLVLKLVFYILQKYCRKISPLSVTRATTVFQMSRGLLATLWQIWN
jgi:hypothetical protein